VATLDLGDGSPDRVVVGDVELDHLDHLVHCDKCGSRHPDNRKLHD
jgi:hypothetical protein